jgi:hypothetical protein
MIRERGKKITVDGASLGLGLGSWTAIGMGWFRGPGRVYEELKWAHKLLMLNFRPNQE